MTYELDIHCHCTASGHAYSSLEENVRSAAEKNLKLLAITDHGPAMPAGAHLYYFYNLKIIPKEFLGVRVLKGVELNITDYKGTVDLPDELIEELDFRIASLHPPCLPFGTTKEHTTTIIKAMERGDIHVLGHPGDIRYDFDIPAVVKAAKETNTLLEINNSSLLPTSFRPGGDTMIRKIIEEAGKQDIPLIMGSDAHFSPSVGDFSSAAPVLKDMGFPEEKILNGSVENFAAYLGLEL